MLKPKQKKNFKYIPYSFNNDSSWFFNRKDIKPIVEIIDLIQNSNRSGTLSFFFTYA